MYHSRYSLVWTLQWVLWSGPKEEHTVSNDTEKPLSLEELEAHSIRHMLRSLTLSPLWTRMELPLLNRTPCGC